MCQNVQYLCNAQDTTQAIQEMQRNIAFVIKANEICTGIPLHIYYSKNIHVQLVQMTNYHFYRPQTKFAKVMFSQVSVCSWGGGVSAPLHAGIHPPGLTPNWADTPPGKTPSWAHTPPWAHLPGRHPPAQCMLGYTHPCPVHAGIHSTSGKYVSYWNAFLYYIG